jgi:Ca2+-binding RTX toxin-like protein
MATLTVSSTHDYSADALTDVTLIDFTNAVSAATATFAAFQFNGAAIRGDVTIDGSDAPNLIVVNGANLLDASQWVFTNWVESQDHVFINGGSGNDTIVGSSKDDQIVGGDGVNIITGGGGADTLIGGNAADIFVYDNASQFVAGETVDGAGGTDALHLNLAGVGWINFASGGLTGIEQLIFDSASSANLDASDFGTAAGLINSVTGSAGFDQIVVVGSVADLSGVAFTSWTAGVDSIIFLCSAGNDTIVGSSQNDLFQNGFVNAGGTDSLTGGAGDDRFQLEPPTVTLGDSVHGGSGTGDTIEKALFGNLRLDLVNISGVERLNFFVSPDTTTLTGSQIGVGAINTVIGNLFTNRVVVAGTTVNLSGVVFNSWDGSEDTITVNGTAGNDTLIGSSRNDTINGGDLNDTLAGGAGTDSLNGGAGNDIYVLGAEAGADAIVDTSGRDTIFTTINRNLTNYAGIEDLVLQGTGHAAGTGDNNFNGILGNNGNNVLAGQGGNDALEGRGGADFLFGQAGQDSLVGGLGNDTFVYQLASDSVAGPTCDYIRDFDDADNDRIDLAGVFGGVLTYIGVANAFTGANQVRSQVVGGNIVVAVNLDGDAPPEMQILLLSTTAAQMGADDFVL